MVENGTESGARRVTRRASRRQPDRALRYLHEPTPGLLSARHRGALEARGEILVFADDDIDASPDSGSRRSSRPFAIPPRNSWVGAICRATRRRLQLGSRTSGTRHRTAAEPALIRACSISAISRWPSTRTTSGVSISPSVARPSSSSAALIRTATRAVPPTSSGRRRNGAHHEGESSGTAHHLPASGSHPPPRPETAIERRIHRAEKVLPGRLRLLHLDPPESGALRRSGRGDFREPLPQPPPPANSRVSARRRWPPRSGG